MLAAIAIGLNVCIAAGLALAIRIGANKLGGATREGLELCFIALNYAAIVSATLSFLGILPPEIGFNGLIASLALCVSAWIVSRRAGLWTLPILIVALAWFWVFYEIGRSCAIGKCL